LEVSCFNICCKRKRTYTKLSMFSKYGWKKEEEEEEKVTSNEERVIKEEEMMVVDF